MFLTNFQTTVIPGQEPSQLVWRLSVENADIPDPDPDEACDDEDVSFDESVVSSLSSFS